MASPFDFSKVPLVAPLRPIDAVTRGWLVTQLYRGLGGAPAPLVKRGYQLAGFDKYVMKPWTVALEPDDRELLAQIEAVDAFMARMHAYPGRTFGQLYHRFFRTNDLADGQLRADRRGANRPRRRRRSRCWRSPAAATGSRPWRPATTSRTCVPNAASLKLETAPGGHLGVLTGRAARRTTWPMLDAFLDARRVAARQIA